MQYLSGSKTFDLSLLILGLVLVFVGSREKISPKVVPEPKPIVIPIVPDVPELDQYIYYDQYDKVLQLAKAHNKKVVLIFSANWCGHCKSLKKDIELLYHEKKVLVCVIDIDKDKKLIKPYDVSGLPTSIIVDCQNKEIARKTGYNQNIYEQWLNENL